MLSTTKRSKQTPLLSRTARAPVSVLAILVLISLLSFLTLLPAPPESTHYDSVTTGTRADWKTLPPYCKTMLENPKPFHKYCNRNRTTMVCDPTSGEWAGKTLLFSQIAQDYYMYTRHFKHLKRPGVYAEVATNDPIWGSNTLFMDRCLGWKGVCIEANPKYVPYIHRLRGCEVVPTCVSQNDKEVVNFLMMNDAGGIEYSNKNKETYKGKVESLRLECMSMKMVLERRGILVLDYLSLDVEGHELKVLQGFDWEHTKVNVMTIETTVESLIGIQEFLEGIGYVRHTPDLNEESRRTGLLRRDAIFLHGDVVWGKPV